MPPLVANYGRFVSTYDRGMLLKDAETFANGAETFTFGAACGKKVRNFRTFQRAGGDVMWLRGPEGRRKCINPTPISTNNCGWCATGYELRSRVEALWDAWRSSPRGRKP